MSEGKKNTNTGNLGSHKLDYKAGEASKGGNSRMKNGTSSPKPFTERGGTTAGS